MTTWLELFGRLHPLVLHLPIGLAVGLAALELLARARRAELAPALRSAAAVVVAASAVLAATSGYVLGTEEEYGGGGVVLERHKKLGIAIAAGAVLMALACLRALGGERPLARRAYGLLLALVVLLLVPGSHLGSTLTRGSGWLLGPLGRADDGALAPEPSTFSEVIAPLFEARCTSCHGPLKKKGGLRLHEPAAILAGGEDGVVLVPGDPARSEMVRRLRLPASDEDHMPPEGKRQLAEEDIDRIEAWIAAGAPFEGRVELAEASLASAGSAPGTNGGAGGGADPESDGITPADPAALAELSRALVHVERLSRDSELLWVDFAAVAPAVGDAEVARLLEPLRGQLGELSLARTAITDATLALLARCPALRRLELRDTAVTSAGLRALEGHPALEELGLAQTALDDGAVESLLLLPALGCVTLWESGLSEAGLARLAAERPALSVTIDAPLPGPIESEGELVFTGERPLPGGAAPTLAPVNTTCPVSGNPVKPDYAVVFGGRVIGFCCPNCPKEFWAEPGRYREKLP